MKDRFTYAKAYRRKEKFDLQLGAALDDQDKLAQRLQNSTIELKTERFLWEETGNMYIEYKCRGKPSGLADTPADFWCHELARDEETLCYIIIPIDRLKAICRTKYNTPADNKRGGDDGESAGIKLRISDLLGEF